MKIKNDLVRIKVGKKKYDFHNLILNEYLRRFALAQIDKENTLKGKLTQSRELNYILLKLDTSLEITESSKLYYNDFDICIINQAKHFQDLSENQITIQYDYNTKENMFVVDISVSSQATETTSGTIKSLNNFYGKKITAIGFSSGWAPWANYPICAVLDTSNYNIYLEENQEFSVTRRDIITTDAEFYSNDKDKVPAPVHLAPYGVPQIINQSDIVDSEGTINSFYSNAYGALYSIGKGYVPNVIEEEKIIGENAKVVNNGTSLTISSVENEDVGTEALYPSEDLYPIGKFVEEIQTSEKGVQVSIKGNEEDAFVQIDGKSTQATRSGKNLLDASKISNSNIIVSDNGKTIKMPIATSGNGYTSTSRKLSELCPNLKVGDTVYLYGNTTSNFNRYIYIDSLWHYNKERTITQNDLDSTVILYGNRFQDGETEQVIISNLMITKENDNTWEQYGASPSPEFPSEIKSVGDEGTVTIEQKGKNKANVIGNQSITNHGITLSVDNNQIFTLSGTHYDNPPKGTAFNLISKLKTANYFSYTIGDKSTIFKKGTYIAKIDILSENITGEKNGIVFGITTGTTTPAPTTTIGILGDNNSLSNTFTLEEENSIAFVLAFMSSTIGTVINDLKFRISILEETEATDYEPYFSKDYVIPLSAPLRSLPNGTKDTIEEDGIHRRVGSEIITMNDIAKANTSYSNVVYAQITKPNNFIGYNNYNYNAVLCNKAESLKLPVGNFDNNKMIGKINTEAHKTMFWIGFPVGTTLDEMKSILDGTIIQYELAEEVVEPFTEEQLEVINSMITEKGTNIFSVNNELNPEIKVTEYKSPLYPIKDNYKYLILKYKVWQEVATGEYTEEDGYIQEITDTGYYYHQAIPLEEYGTLNTTIKYERG